MPAPGVDDPQVQRAQRLQLPRDWRTRKGSRGPGTSEAWLQGASAASCGLLSVEREQVACSGPCLRERRDRVDGKTGIGEISPVHLSEMGTLKRKVEAKKAGTSGAW